jgi:hypothetical protein
MANEEASPLGVAPTAKAGSAVLPALAVYGY